MEERIWGEVEESRSVFLKVDLTLGFTLYSYSCSRNMSSSLSFFGVYHLKLLKTGEISILHEFNTIT